MSGTFVSFLDITGDSIVTGPVPCDPFLPNSANMFPKMVNRIDADSWELWEFDTFTADGAMGIGLSFYRDARGLEKGGFHVEINAIWPDGTKWSETLLFAESTITSEGDKAPDHGHILGIWKTKTIDSSDQPEESICFTISADSSLATVRFAVPGRLTGTIEMRSSGSKPEDRVPATDQAAQLCPGVYYMFPMGPTHARGDVVFGVPNSGEERRLSFSEQTGGRGGMVRGWSSRAWPTFMNDAYYIVAHAGPYMVQMLRVLGSIFAQHKPCAVARLYYKNELVCAANEIVDLKSAEETAPEFPVVKVDKIIGGNDADEGLVGEFRDKNIGYSIDFMISQDKQWHFTVHHKRALWSEPTSAPGPEGTGKSGWIESFSGGNDSERFEGMGVAGQLQIPVP